MAHVHGRFLLAIVFIRGIGTQEVQEICSFETFSAVCGESEVVVMTLARYGRMQLGECVKADVGYVGCAADVLGMADTRCSGKHSCSIPIPDAEFDSTQPCLAELKLYLEASHICMPVVTPSVGQCVACGEGTVVRAGAGTLASLTTLEHGCGSPDCPWILQADPGQIINITLIDFAVRDPGAGCRVYATLREPELGMSETICGGLTRSHPGVYLSTGSVLEIRVVGQDAQTDSQRFLLQYAAVGCPNPPVPSGGWSRRNDDSAVLGCDGSSDTWVLRCNGNTWMGQWQNCTSGSPMFGSSEGGIHFPSGLSILIILAISIALAILIFGVGIVCLRRHQTAGSGGPPERAHSLAPPPPPVAVDQYGKPIYGRKPSGHAEFPVPGMKNEYTHIWQMPLPQPDTQPQYVPRGGSVVYEECPEGGAAYESVPEVQSYGNHTLARQGMGQELEHGVDPRYFQLDPDLDSATQPK